MADFVHGPYETSLATGEIILGFDVPRPSAPLRWGFAKVVRKSGAFANSIAYRCRARARWSGVGRARRCRAAPMRRLPTAAEQLRAGAGSEDGLRAAIAADLEAHVPGADAYENECTPRRSFAP